MSPFMSNFAEDLKNFNKYGKVSQKVDQIKFKKSMYLWKLKLKNEFQAQNV